VPVPSDPFSFGASGDIDPLRRPIFIPVKRSVEVRGLCDILERFGFVLMGERQFVHVSGGVFAMPLNSGGGGFLWAWNYMLGRRYRSASTGDEAFLDALLADFRRFCGADAVEEDGRLDAFLLARSDVPVEKAEECTE